MKPTPVLRMEVTEALTMNSRSPALTCEELENQHIPSGGFQRVLDPTDYRLFTDEALVDLTRAGNNAAFDELVERYCPSVYGLALSVLKNEKDAGDALCRAFVAARKDAHSVGDRCSPGTWLYLHGLREVFKTLNPKP